MSKSKIKRIIILGHNGFIGRHQTAYLKVASADIEIIGRSLPEFDLTSPDQINDLAKLFDNNTAVIMFSCIKKQWGDNLEIYAKNMSMVMNLCQGLKEYPINRFVYFSSAEVYGHENNVININEETPVNPTSYYGIAKYASECLIRQAIREHSASTFLVLRPPLIYGPGDTSRGYGPSGFVWSAVKQQPIKLWGEGDELREFVFIDDLVKIVHVLLLNDYDGIVNIASGRSNTFREMLNIISRLSRADLTINNFPRTKSKVDISFNNQKIAGLLPGFTFTSLVEGIKQTYAAEEKANEK